MKNANKAQRMKEAANASRSATTGSAHTDIVGIDVGDRVSRFCRLNSEGEIV